MEKEQVRCKNFDWDPLIGKTKSIFVVYEHE